MPEFNSDYVNSLYLVDDFTRGYIEAAYFTSTGPDDGIDPETPLSDEAYDDAELECKHFQRFQRVWLNIAYNSVNYDETCAGRDFWFTRNGHGVGFWDRKLDGACGEVLSNAARQYGEVYLILGDDGLLHFE